ncbi:MAG TPA: tetratricopeptide repeat protein [Syntrophaceae bacterium]|nr:tetratricopeptide repeat protein [Syntrophaceae bacterium]
MVKIKVSKKRLVKGPHQFISVSDRILTYISNNARTLIFISVAFFIVVGILVGLWIHRGILEKEALTLYYRAHQKDGSLAKDLQELTERYPHTAIARCALLELGNIYYKNHDIDKAISAYQRYEKHSSHGNLRLLVYDSLGYCFESKGDYVKASQFFKKIIKEKGDFLHEMAYINLGRVYEKAGNTTDAIRNYQEFIKRYPSSPYLPMIKDRLSKLTQEK